MILRVLLEAGEDLVKVEKIKGEDGNPDILITLDRSKIISVGKPAIGDFLRKLQVGQYFLYDKIVIYKCCCCLFIKYYIYHWKWNADNIFTILHLISVIKNESEGMLL